MEPSEVKAKYEGFLANYTDETEYWKKKSEEFWDFWNHKMLDDSHEALGDEEIDSIVRILDTHGKGKRKEDIAVANCMIYQYSWRTMFRDIKGNQDLKSVLSDIFKESNENKLSKLIDGLEDKNKDRKNWLTGPSGRMVNVMLFITNPEKYISVISLNDRRKIIKFFDFKGLQESTDNYVGTEIVSSNKAIINGFRTIGIEGSPRTISEFLYKTIRSYWKPEVERVKTPMGDVDVSIPSDDLDSEDESGTRNAETYQIQAKVAYIGEALGFNVWLPNPDRSRVTQTWTPGRGILLDELPLGYDNAVQKIVKLIDVLWIKKRAVVRAFEIERKSSIYSGILRMADLLALQPNLNIKMCIVSPASRRDEVLQQINRPAFLNFGEKGLADMCSFLSFDSVKEISELDHLTKMKPEIIDEFVELSGGYLES